MKTIIALFALALSLLTGCTTIRPNEQRNPAPSSSLSPDEAHAMAVRARAGNPLHEVAFVLPTGSMVPTLDSRTSVLIEKYAGQTLRKGDIVLFHRDGSLPILHRVVEVRGSFVLTAGDNNRYVDGWISETSISHRVVALFYAAHDETPPPRILSASAHR